MNDYCHYTAVIHSECIACMLLVGDHSLLNCFILFLLVGYRVYDYSIFAATSVGEGPSANGRFLTGEDSELINTL